MARLRRVERAPEPSDAREVERVAWEILRDIPSDAPWPKFHEIMRPLDQDSVELRAAQLARKWWFTRTDRAVIADHVARGVRPPLNPKCLGPRTTRGAR